MDFALPLWANASDGYLLMKFTSKDIFQQAFLDGKLFFNTADFFAACEGKGRRDSNEGNTFVVNYNNPDLKAINYEFIDGEIALVYTDYSSNPKEYRPGTVWDFSAAENRKRKIICFYTLLLDIEHQKVGEFPTNMKDEFGEYGILILNRQEFYKRVSDAFLRYPECQKIHMGFVDYKIMQPGINQWYPFRKDANDFSYQNEFRMTFVNDTEEPFTLDLETSLQDIATPIMAGDVDEIHFKDGKLLYPTYTIQEAIPVTSVTLNKASTILGVGDIEMLIPTISPNNATNKKVTWKSDKPTIPTIATVDSNGKVEVVASGMATITMIIEEGGKTANCSAIVKVAFD